MKMILAALLVVSICCFAPGTSLYIPDANNDEDDSAGKFSCLATLTGERKDDAKMAMIDFLCTRPKYMDPKYKEELIEFIQEIVTVTGCTQRDFLGSDTNIEELVKDHEEVLRKLTLNMKQLLGHLHKTEIPIYVCQFLDNLKNNAAATLEETSIPSGHRRLTRSLGGTLGGLTGLLNLLNGLSPLLSVVGGLGGTAGNLLSPVANIVNGLLGGGSGLGLLGGLLGGNQGGLLPSLLNGGLLDGLLGGGKGGLLSGTLGNLLGGGQGCGVGGGAGDGLLGSLLGGGKGQASGGLLNTVTNLAGGITGGVAGENGLLGGLLGGNKGQGSGGLLSGVGDLAGGILGGPSGGILGSLVG